MTTPHPPNFDRVARVYRWAEYIALGPLLQRTRTHFLPQLTHCRRALVLGDGDGRFTAQLLHQQPQVHALAVDTSATMLHLLRQRCVSNIERLQTLQASALDVTPSRDTDLVATHFFLDCLTQSDVNALTKAIAAKLRPGALWLLSDFAIPRHALLKPLATLYIRALYFAFRVLTGLRVAHLPDPQTALREAGFERIAHHSRLRGLIYTEVWRLR